MKGNRFQKHPVLTGFLIAIIMVTLTLSVVEISLRLFTDYPPSPFGFIKDKELGHFIRTGFHKKHFAPDGEPYPISTNTLGLFDSEYNGEQPAVLLIGDSFTISAVPFEDKWGRLLEKSLNIKVVKGGVSAYGTEKEYLLLKRLAPVVKPKLIILGYYINDPVDDYIGIDRYDVVNGHLYEKKTVNPVTGKIYKKHFTGYLEMLAKHYSATFGFLKDKMRLFTEKCLHINTVVEEFDPTYALLFDPKLLWTENLYTINFNNIIKIKQYTESIHANLLVLVIPAKEQVYDHKWGKAYSQKYWYDRELPVKKVVQFLETNGIMYVNLLEYFKVEVSMKSSPASSKTYYFDNDIHWTKEGDRLAAEIIAEYIRSHNLLSQKSENRQ